MQSYTFFGVKKVKKAFSYNFSAQQKQQNSMERVTTFRQKYIQHEVFEGVAAKKRGRSASNEPRTPLFGPRAAPTDPQDPYLKGSKGNVGLKAGFTEPT